MDNPEILATLCTQDEEKPIKNNTMCVGHQYKQTNTNSVNKTSALIQTTRGKDKPICCCCCCCCGNRNEHHDAVLRT